MVKGLNEMTGWRTEDERGVDGAYEAAENPLRLMCCEVPWLGGAEEISWGKNCLKGFSLSWPEGFFQPKRVAAGLDVTYAVAVSGTVYTGRGAIVEVRDLGLGAGKATVKCVLRAKKERGKRKRPLEGPETIFFRKIGEKMAPLGP